MLEFQRNKLLNVTLREPETLVVHGVLDDSIYSLEVDLEVRLADLVCLSVSGRWHRWTTPECPRALQFLREINGLDLRADDFESFVHKTVGRHACRHFANLLIECGHAAREAALVVGWERARKGQPGLSLAAYAAKLDFYPAGVGPLAGNAGEGEVDEKPAPRAPAVKSGASSRSESGEPALAASTIAAAKRDTEPSRPDGFLVDMHLHTSPASPCASSPAAVMVARAAALGLDAVCLTDHNYCWSQAAAAELAAAHHIIVLRGNEIVTDQGDMLVFGFYDDVQGVIGLTELRRRVDVAGGIIIAAHPFRGFLTFGAGHLGLTPEKAAERETFGLVDGLEVMNGKVTESENQLAAMVAERLKLPGTGGSDAHDDSTVGRYVTRFEEPVTTEAELIAAIRAGACRAVPFVAGP